MITGKTKIAGIFGDPVEHSLSPAMHNAAFSALGLDWAYVPFHVAVRPGGLKKAVEAVRSLGLTGVNVTIPHKEKVIKYLDEVEQEARLVGAVNTIVNENGRLIGCNTDGLGFLESLKKEARFKPKGKKIIVIGAGGAARGIVSAFLFCDGESTNSVIIANRTASRAKRLAAEFKKKFRRADILAVPLAGVGGYFKDADLLVNTTSAGMLGKADLKLPLRKLPGRAVVSDIVYNPLKTGLIKDAEKAGLKTHGGLGMLVGQGAISFELWTGRKAPVNIMRRAALKALKQK